MDLNGTYRGFSPTDESSVCLGELEVVVTDHNVSLQFATGLTVESDRAPRVLLRSMSQVEVASHFNTGADIMGVTGYQLGEQGPIFLYLAEVPDTPEAARVLLLRFGGDEVDSIFGPSFLYAPDQVEEGWFDQAITRIETEQADPGVVPRLAKNL